MKKIFKSKITVVILSCLLLVSVFAGVYALANDNSVSIEYVNIVHDGQVKIAYKLDVQGLNDGEVLQMNFWGTTPVADADGVYAEPQMSNEVNMDTVVYENGLIQVESKGFAPAEMTQVVYAQAVIMDGEEVVAHSKLVRYSIFEHICYLAYNGGDADDVAMFEALESYITYAQKYLGWTENATPDELCYIQVNNGYIKPMDGTDNKYTSGMYMKDTYLTIVANNPETFGLWRNEILGTNLTKEEQMKVEYAIQLIEDRIYTALDKVTVTATDGEIIPVSVAPKASTEGNNTGYQIVRKNAKAVTTYATGDWFAASTPFTRVNGDTTEYFSHWEDQNGNYVSSAATYVADASSYAVAGCNELTLTPVYTAKAPTLCEVASQELGRTEYDKYESKHGRYTVDTSSKTANAGGAAVLQFRGSAANASKVAERTVYSFTLNIDSANGGRAVSDFFTESSTMHYQNYFGNTSKTFALIEFHSVDLDKDGKLDGYFVTSASSTGGNTRTEAAIRNGSIGVAEYGKDCKIDLEIITDTSNGTNKLAAVNVYMNGEYVGTSTLPYTSAHSYGAATTLNMQFHTVMRTRSVITIANPVISEYTYVKEN